MRRDATQHYLRAQYAGRTHAFVLNVETTGNIKHGPLMNVIGMREGERKRIRRERLGGGDEDGIPERKGALRLIHFE